VVQCLANSWPHALVEKSTEGGWLHPLALRRGKVRPAGRWGRRILGGEGSECALFTNTTRTGSFPLHCAILRNEESLPVVGPIPRAGGDPGRPSYIRSQPVSRDGRVACCTWRRPASEP
jgi:hypothetical protein